MLIIPIDKLKKKGGLERDPVAKLKLNTSGQLILNVSAVKLLNIQDMVPVFMHFYQDEDVFYIKIDVDKLHSVRFLYNDTTALCKAYSRTTTRFFLDHYNEKSVVTFKILNDDFGKFKLVKI